MTIHSKTYFHFCHILLNLIFFCGVTLEQICYLAAQKHKMFVETSNASLMIISSYCVFMISENFHDFMNASGSCN